MPAPTISTGIRRVSDGGGEVRLAQPVPEFQRCTGHFSHGGKAGLAGTRGGASCGLTPASEAIKSRRRMRLADHLPPLLLEMQRTRT